MGISSLYYYQGKNLTLILSLLYAYTQLVHAGDTYMYIRTYVRSPACTRLQLHKDYIHGYEPDKTIYVYSCISCLIDTAIFTLFIHIHVCVYNA